MGGARCCVTGVGAGLFTTYAQKELMEMTTNLLEETNNASIVLE